jgi:hypothetical protein
MKIIPSGGERHRPKRIKPGAVKPGHVGIYDHKGNLRGHLHGPGGSAATVERFGVHNAKLQRVRGASAWVGEAPKARPTARASAISLSKSLRAAKGSNR